MSQGRHPSRREATCAQELISGNERLFGKSMFFNRRHSAASFSLVLSGIAKVEGPVCWFENGSIIDCHSRGVFMIRPLAVQIVARNATMADMVLAPQD